MGLQSQSLLCQYSMKKVWLGKHETHMLLCSCATVNTVTVLTKKLLQLVTLTLVPAK